MKQSLFLLIIFILFTTSIFSQEFEDEKRLIVTGGAEIVMPADNATFSFEVTGKGPTLKDAVTKAKQKIALISKELYKIGIEKGNLRTSFFSSTENFGDKSFWSSKDDFKTQMKVIVSIDSLELLEPVILKISEFKPDRISNIKFNLLNYALVKITALETAIKKARQKAELLAKNMNTKLGNVMYIEEIQNTISSKREMQNFPNPYNTTTRKLEFLGQSFEKSGSFFAQQLKIRARVKVVIGLAGSKFE